MSLIQRNFFRVCTMVAIALLLGSGSVAAEETASESADVQIRVGFNGHSCLGAWFPVFVTPNLSADAIKTIARYEIDTLDGDGSPVTIAGPAVQASAQPGTFQCVMQSGRRYGERRLRLVDNNENVVWQATFRLQDSGQGHVALASTDSLAVVLETQTQLSSRLATSGYGTEDRSTFVVKLDAATEFPEFWLAWQSVETLFLTGSQLEQIQALSDRQLDALEQWIEKGGRLVLSVAESGDQLLRDGQALRRFCPGNFLQTDKMNSSSRLEFFAGSNQQLMGRDSEPIRVSRLQDVNGVVNLQQDDLPLIVSSPRGFGEIVFVAFDLTDPRLMEWSGFGGVLGKLSRDTDDGSRRPRGREQRGSTVSHYGYQDLTGQLRVPLDRFAGVSFVSFTWVAVLIGLYILCIGPGDYFLLSRVFKRMELTWITFPLISLMFCSIAWYTSQFARPPRTQLNQLEIIDFDQASGRVRGNVWNNLYSPAGGKSSLKLPASNDLNISLNSKILGWQGLPGGGLGGMGTRSGTSLIDEPYRQVFEANSDSVSKTDSVDSDFEVYIADQPLRVSSTRAFFSQWWGQTPFEISNRLSFNQRIRRLEGTFTNPLDRQLKNCRLLFDNWAYVLPHPLEPGETIDVLTEMKERTARSYLNRRTRETKESNKGQNIPWDPTDTNVSRIAEMLMFYRAGGGSEYTGLTHDYQSFIDMSDHLILSQAILVGELDEPVTRVQIDNETSGYDYDNVTTLIRIMLPVERR